MRFCRLTRNLVDHLSPDLPSPFKGEGRRGRGLRQAGERRTATMKETGQVLVLLALMLTMLFAIAALAMDVGMAYVVKTKLSAAVDAAALAAGKVVAAQDGMAAIEAEKFFYANYPDGLLGATVEKPTTEASYDHKEKTWKVTVTSKASVPTYFARVLNWNSFDVQALATSTINSVDMVLVLDASSSLGPPTTAQDALPQLKAAAKEFIGMFNHRNDRVGLIHFASGAEENVKITSATGFNRQRLVSEIDAINRGGYTTAEEALRLAKQQLDSIPVHLRSRLRLIVFFADGAPNGIAAEFPTDEGLLVGALSSEFQNVEEPQNRLHAVGKKNDPFAKNNNIYALPCTDWTGTVSIWSFNGKRTLSSPVNVDTSAIPYTECNLNRAARNMVENIANAARGETGPSVTPINIFTIGLGANMNQVEGNLGETCGYGSEEHGGNIMRRLANVPSVDTYNPSQPPGIYAFASSPEELKSAFDEVSRAILRLSR